MCDYDFAVGSRIRTMPDVHAGKGCTIGTTMTVTDKVVPNIVGGYRLRYVYRSIEHNDS